ncbi:MAG: ribose-5-phosphate isomerase rki1 [Chaenotheca gracillima]|nr:MAG: ribose-5-phosphate isomerase rki1 [Chaenotheca gracillima]
MQSGPSEVDQQTLSNEQTVNQTTSTQHGLHRSNHPVSPASSVEGRGDLPSSEDPTEDVENASETMGPDAEELHTVISSNHSESSSSSSLDRITEYENDHTSAFRRNDFIPGFRVTKGKRSDNEASIIAQFPNEVLTHVLSHLPPQSLSTVALVSRRFHALVTTPHAWRDAFSRFFPGPDALELPQRSLAGEDIRSRGHELDGRPSKKRLFARLTAQASWQSEYILRTRLLRSLGRGKPAQTLRASSTPRRSGSTQGSSATTTYNTQLFATIDKLHGSFGPNPSRKPPRFIHGSGDVGSVCSSDAITGKVDNWGLSDPQTFLQFDERFPGDAPWGLGSGEVLGCSNVLDVSQPYGMVYGEGSPGGLVYFRSVNEMRGRFLAFSARAASSELGIPQIPGATEAICSVWISKTKNLPELSDGIIGILSGSSYGVLTSYSLGTDGLRDQRIDRGTITARWVLSPGVPIVAIAGDDFFSDARRAKGRVFAVALNALGEVFHLTDMPKRPKTDRGMVSDERASERLAWATGRSVPWTLVESTRRVARVDPYAESDADGSYTPRSSWHGMGLSTDQIIAETREIETFILYKPKHFRKICEGWDMRRKMEVDFAGEDGYGAGESVVIIRCGHETDESPSMSRFTRCRLPPTSPQITETLSTARAEVPVSSSASLFGGSVWETKNQGESTRFKSHSPEPASGHVTPRPFIEEWRHSALSLDPFRNIQITATALDLSSQSLLATFEDPLLSSSKLSPTLPPMETSLKQPQVLPVEGEVPGQRARFIAIGTNDGRIMMWDMRGPVSANGDLVNELAPFRIIHTDSPQISCLALSALYLVHGGNDGLVQAWDPLASTLQPVRTLNSRFSSRARRRLVQAEASVQGVGINLFAAGAVCLDPDPTVLRGMVSLGTHLRYWSYSSSAADNYASRKRRLRRRSERGSANNSGDGRFSNSGRGALQDYITNEKLELEHEKERRRREADRLAGRFGVGLLGQAESEEEVLAYARMLSEETFAKDEEKRRSESESAEDFKGSDTSSAWSSDTVTPEGSAAGRSPPIVPELKDDDELDADIAKAISLSLGDEAHHSAQFSQSPMPSLSYTPAEIPIRYVKSRRSSPSQSPPLSTRRDVKMGDPPAARNNRSGSSSDAAAVSESDLDFALQLSLAEETSRKEAMHTQKDFPTLKRSDDGEDAKGKGKGKATQ